MRLEGWEIAFFELIRDARTRPFAWGDHDCCLFAADVIRALTGVDVAADLRGRYSTAIGAKRVITREGGSLDALAEARFPALGITELPAAAYAQRGDILRLKEMPGD